MKYLSMNSVRRPTASKIYLQSDFIEQTAAEVKAKIVEVDERIALFYPVEYFSYFEFGQGFIRSDY